MIDVSWEIIKGTHNEKIASFLGRQDLFTHKLLTFIILCPLFILLSSE